MRRNALATTACFVSLFTAFCASSATAQDNAQVKGPELIWQVDNPFRFYKAPRPFALHEAAFIVKKIALEAWRTDRYHDLTLGSSAWLLLGPFLLVEWLRRRELHALAKVRGPGWLRLALYTGLLWGALGDAVRLRRGA